MRISPKSPAIVALGSGSLELITAACRDSNLPIRTLVLYSVQRVSAGGARENLLTRDIKNLVGRAGRAGSTTKGLVICINPDQWAMVAPVAQQAAGEPVVGALRSLIESVRRQLALQNLALTNEMLESSSAVHSLIDGVDATLVDLAASEIGEAELLQLAINLADQTFASQQTDNASKQLLRDVFSLRTQRISALRSSGRLVWVKETGARARMVAVAETGLFPRRPSWDDVVAPDDPSFVDPLLEWAWTQTELQEAAREAYRIAPDVDVDSLRDSFIAVVKLWLSGAPFIQIAEGASLPVDDLLGVHAKMVTFALQTMVEQALALLEKLLQERGQAISPAVLRFSDHLRFGVPTVAGCTLAAGGVTHRRSFVEIGKVLEPLGIRADDRAQVFDVAQRSVEAHREQWRTHLGTLVFRRTLKDLSSVTQRRPADE